MAIGSENKLSSSWDQKEIKSVAFISHEFKTVEMATGKDYLIFQVADNKEKKNVETYGIYKKEFYIKVIKKINLYACGNKRLLFKVFSFL